MAIWRAETICFRWLNCLQKAVVLVANLSIAFQESFGFLQSNDGEYLTVMRQTHGGVVAQRHHLLEMLTSTFKPARLTQTRCWTAHFTCSAPAHVQTGRVNLHQTWQWKQTFKGTLAYTSSTAQGGGGSFKNRKPIGEVGCCESGMAKRIHWWIERCLISLTLSLSFSAYLPTYLLTYLPTYLSIFYLSIYLSFYLSIYLSISLSLSIYLSIYLPTYLPS